MIYFVAAMGKVGPLNVSVASGVHSVSPKFARLVGGIQDYQLNQLKIMLTRTIVELDQIDYRHVRYFEIDIDGGESFNYRSRVSLNAFFNINYTRNENDKLLYVELPKRNFDDGIPVIKIDSLWEFYKLIGYNYKIKKYEN